MIKNHLIAMHITYENKLIKAKAFPKLNQENNIVINPWWCLINIPSLFTSLRPKYG